MDFLKKFTVVLFLLSCGVENRISQDEDLQNHRVQFSQSLSGDKLECFFPRMENNGDYAILNYTRNSFEVHFRSRVGVNGYADNYHDWFSFQVSEDTLVTVDKDVNGILAEFRSAQSDQYNLELSFNSMSGEISQYPGGELIHPFHSCRKL